MSHKHSSVLSLTISPYLGTVMCCVVFNFVCLGRNFSPLGQIKIYNVESHGKLIVIWKVLLPSSVQGVN
jgi:hypothetical protein